MNKNVFIFLHGWDQDKTSLYSLGKLFSRYGEVLYFDLPYFGKEKCDKVLTIDDYISFVHEKIKNYPNAYLVGHSFGGKIASFYALKYEVKGLILIAPSTYIRKSIKTVIKIYLYKLLKFVHIPLYKLFKGSKDYQNATNNKQQTFKNILVYLKKKELRKISCPVLLIGFRNDTQIKQKDLLYLYKNIPHCAFFYLKGDHFSYLENGEYIASLLGDFIHVPSDI